MVCISSFVDDVMFGHNRLGDAISVYTEKNDSLRGTTGGEVSDIYYCLVFNVCVLICSLLWPPYVIGGPLYFCPVVSFLLSSSSYSFFFFLA